MRNRRGVGDRNDHHTGGLQRADRHLAARARTLDVDVDLAQPCSIARRAACSAVTWAAYGVLLREPLKPFEPALDQCNLNQ